MKEQFLHTLTTSFMLWVDHKITVENEAYSEYAATYKRVGSIQVNGTDTYITFRNKKLEKLLYDVTNASTYCIDETTDSLSTSIGNINQGDYFVDFHNGYICVKDNVIGANTEFELTSPQQSYKTFDIVYTSDDEPSIIARFLDSSPDKITANVSAPILFVSSDSMENEGFAFGGLDRTTSFIKIMCVAQDNYQLDGFLSIMADAYNLDIPMIESSQHPIGQLGRLKSYPYEYLKHVSTYSSGNSIYVDECKTSKLSPEKPIPGLFVGFADFDVKTARYHR